MGVNGRHEGHKSAMGGLHDDRAYLVEEIRYPRKQASWTL